MKVFSKLDNRFGMITDKIYNGHEFQQMDGYVTVCEPSLFLSLTAPEQAE